MNTRSAMLNITLVAASFAFASIALPNSLPPDVVAEVNSTVIAKKQLNRVVRWSGLPDSPRLRTAIKNQLIARELFRQAAARQHLGNRPEVKAAIREAREDMEIRIYLRGAVNPRPVTQKDVRAKYDTIVNSLGKNEYKVQIIRVADDATAHKVLAQFKAGASFGTLARRYSTAPSRVRGGEINWVSFKTPLVDGETQGFPLPVARAIVKQPAGAVSATPITWNGERYLIKVNQVRRTQIPRFNEVAPHLKQMLELAELQRATAGLVAKLMKNAKIEQ